MAEETILGINGFTEQPRRREYQIDKGWVSTRTWEGPQALVDAFVDTLQVLEPPPEQIRYEYGVPAKVEADFPAIGGTTGGELPSDIVDENNAVWEMIGQQLEKDIRVHGIYNISGASPAAVEKVDESIRRGKAGDVNWDTAYPGFNLNNYRSHRLNGIEAYTSFSYIVRKTISTNKKSALYANDVVPGKVVAWSAIGVPETSKIRQPKVAKYSGGWTDALITEWLVMSPTIRWTSSTKRYDIVREWWGAEKWSGALYQGGSYLTP
jgi:hypothetical protein